MAEEDGGDGWKGVTGYGENGPDIPHPGDRYHTLSDNVPDLPGIIAALMRKMAEKLSPPS